MRFSFIPQLFCEKNFEYIKPKLDSGKEWKPSETGKEDKPPMHTPTRLSGTKPPKLIHPVVGDHLKMEDDPNIDQGPGKMVEVNRHSFGLSAIYYQKSDINDMNFGPWACKQEKCLIYGLWL